MSTELLHNETASAIWAMVDAPYNTVKARVDWEANRLEIATIDGDQVRLDARQAAALAHWLVTLAIPHTIEGAKL